MADARWSTWSSSSPRPRRHVIEALAEVYKQRCARAAGRSCHPSSACSFHQAHSKPVMDDLQRWINEQFEQRLVEPNSGLGKALRYLLKHWEELTLFLRQAGAPLDNNLCEQMPEAGHPSSQRIRCSTRRSAGPRSATST